MSWGPIPWLYPPEVRARRFQSKICIHVSRFCRSCLCPSEPREFRYPPRRSVWLFDKGETTTSLTCLAWIELVLQLYCRGHDTGLARSHHMEALPVSRRMVRTGVRHRYVARRNATWSVTLTLGGSSLLFVPGNCKLLAREYKRIIRRRESGTRF